MNDELKKLLDLQDIDLAIEKISRELEQIPISIDEARGKIKAAQAAFETEKTNLTQTQVARKSKELEVAAQEEKVAKHEKELNSLKSNESYKAMLGEIEAAKREKTRIEDEILILMEEFETHSKELKNTEAESKKVQAEFEASIKTLEGKANQLKAELETENKKREAFIPQVSQEILSRYDFIRTKKKSSAIAPIANGCCTGCNTNLTPSTINEVRKGRDLIICESCSRILFYSAPETQTTPTTA
jgi:uncharacterized protein